MKINNVTKEIIEWTLCILIAVVLGLTVKHYIGTPTLVQHTSMYPTLKQGERLILNRLYKTFNETPKRGEIITFEAPSNQAESLDNPTAIYNNNPQGLFNTFTYYVLEIQKTSYIKRVIGLPGEHLQIQEGKVYINGQLLEESYLEEDVETIESGQFIDVIIPEGYIFVMGDNRASSMDSRSFGCIPISKIEGKVLIRFWPFDRFGNV